MRIWSRSFGRFAVSLTGTAVLFAERGERRDFSDEFRPQRAGQVMAHAGKSREAGVRDGSGENRQVAVGRSDQTCRTCADSAGATYAWAGTATGRLRLLCWAGLAGVCVVVQS